MGNLEGLKKQYLKILEAKVRKGKDIVGLPVEQQIRFVIGKVADRPVVASDGTSIVGQGEVIDENIAWEAERKGALRELVLAAGGRVDMGVLRELREGTTAMKTMRRSRRQPGAPERSETKEAGTSEIIGRRVGRVVLDQDQRVILGTGEMVIHESVERARHAGVLKELNAAAWMEEPHPVGEEKVREEAEMRLEQEEEKKES